MNSTQIAPSADVLAAFGLPSVSPRLLADGRGRCWSVTSAILRPADDEAEATWIAGIFSQLQEDGFRIPRPIPAADGSYVVAGWSAWQFIPGGHDNHGDWQSMLDACAAFHRALEGIDPPGFLATERDHFDRAERIAWGEERCGERWALRETIERILGLADDADKRLTRQLVHGDIAGNLLYEDGMVPGVIDFSPCWRPAAWATAMAIADAIAWQSADAALLKRGTAFGVSDSLLRRAVVFRLAAVSASPDHGATDQQAELQAYSNVLMMLDSPQPAV